MTTEPLSQEDLAAIRARAEAATEGIEGRWRLMTSSQFGRDDRTEVDAGRFTWSWRADAAADPEQAQRDAAFIAAARSDVPALLALVERLQGDLARVREEAVAYRDAEITGAQHVARAILAALDGPAAGGER